MQLPVTPENDGESLTIVEAQINVGFGNQLFIRGQGGGLSWDKGQPLLCIDGSTWRWTAPSNDPVVFKLLLNDCVWSQGEDVVAASGAKLTANPVF